MMKLCILENDSLDPAVESLYQGYGAMFERLLRNAGASGQFDVFNTVRGEYPASFDDYDAVLLTGSRADAFSQEPWVLSLRQKVAQLLQQGKKLVGICFGHQLIALCLGARVGRAPQGWGVGRQRYQWLGQVAAKDEPAPETKQEIALLASHQDQVFDLPQGAALLATSDYCPVAGFTVEGQVFCVQPHPEFVPEYSAFLLDKRRALLGEQTYRTAAQSLQHGHDGLDVARRIVAFIEGRAAD